MIGTSPPLDAATNTKFKGWPACQLRQYFPSYFIGLTKHSVFEVYQTLSHPCRSVAGLNHLIYEGLEYIYTPNLPSMQSQKIEQQALRALISTLLLSVFFG